MKNLIIFFKGFASIQEMYTGFIPQGYDYVFYDELESKNIKNIVKNYKTIIFLGWSLGSLLAIKSINEIKPNKLVLISPTFNFTENFSKQILEKMQKNILKNKELTLKQFFKNCFFYKENYKKFIEKYFNNIKKIEEKKLIKELEYLKNIKIKEEKFNIESLIIYSNKDKIIFKESSIKVFNNFFNSKKIEIDNCGHIIFFEKDIYEIVRSFIIDK
ncbi:serine aminopeptidase S33 family [Hypnocyclicus thermotrophus]|uniref:Serine aminopeptidase S33 family n=1 Tax=Hypnocyclicus thermotrophus TaxID=1627895 RepID=A0AA46I673_9FUSO|nr:alpha/beta fold hydrolase [Hypnocyclicus thermotrophus]TDT71894.1 serine aminopeptidase S33 family [Hypnocyclicus thermotrophus]